MDGYDNYIKTKLDIIMCKHKCEMIFCINFVVFSFLLFSCLVSEMNTLEYSALKKITPSQWKSIRFLLNHENISITMTNQIKTKIFYRYSGWAIYQAIQFKKFHKHKTRNVALKDLTIHSQIGLYKAVKNITENIYFILMSISTFKVNCSKV